MTGDYDIMRMDFKKLMTSNQLCLCQIEMTKSSAEYLTIHKRRKQTVSSVRLKVDYVHPRFHWQEKEKYVRHTVGLLNKL